MLLTAFETDNNHSLVGIVDLLGTSAFVETSMSKNEKFEQMKLSTKLFFPATMICNPFCFLQKFFATNKKQNFKKEITFTTI